MALTLQCVVVRGAKTEQLARLRATAYAPEAGNAPVKATRRSFRFVIRPPQAFLPKTWFSQQVTKDITLVQGELKQ